jgi:cytochrome c556
MGGNMKKLVTVMIFALMTTFVFATGVSEEEQYDQLMKRTGSYMRVLRNSFKVNDRKGVINAAEKLESIFKQDGKFWAKRNTADAVQWSKEAQDAARSIIVSSKKGDDDQAGVALRNLGNSCTSCHVVHREMVSGCNGRIK